jgi:Ca-activated chloride channel family protein
MDFVLVGAASQERSRNSLSAVPGLWDPDWHWDRTMRAPNTRLLLALILAAAAAATSAPQLEVDVELVTLVATVTDADGNYVPGLRAEDFRIEDNGVPQGIAHFSEDTDIPVTLGVALDTSGSMVERMRTALAALDRFIGSLHPDDEIFVTTFSNRVRLVEDLTTDREELSDGLLRVEAAGGTALYDAVADSLGRVQTGRHDKRAVLVLTDGSDTTSDLRLEDALEAVRRAEVLVYGLGIDTLRFADPAEHVEFRWPLTPIPGIAGVRRRGFTDEAVDLGVLESLAGASGGKAWLVSGTWTNGVGEVDAVLDEVASELRNQYTLGYYPSSARDGRFHQLEVSLPQPG